MKSVLPIFLALLFFSDLMLFGQLGQVSGHLYDQREKEDLAYAIVWLVNTKKGATTDLKGNFLIDSIAPGTYSLKVTFLGYGDTTINDIKIQPDKKLTFNLTLPPLCKYDKKKKNKTCPKCGKKDKVIPIVYGLPVGPMDEEKYYYAGCIISYCDPNWHCKRDKYEF